MWGSSASGANGSGGNWAGMVWLLFLLNAPRSALTDRAVRKRIPEDFDNQPRTTGRPRPCKVRGHVDALPPVRTLQPDLHRRCVRHRVLRAADVAAGGGGDVRDHAGGGASRGVVVGET